MALFESELEREGNGKGESKVEKGKRVGDSAKGEHNDSGSAATRVLDLSCERITSRDLAVIASLINLKVRW